MPSSKSIYTQSAPAAGNLIQRSPSRYTDLAYSQSRLPHSTFFKAFLGFIMVCGASLERNGLGQGLKELDFEVICQLQLKGIYEVIPASTGHVPLPKAMVVQNNEQGGQMTLWEPSREDPCPQTFSPLYQSPLLIHDVTWNSPFEMESPSRENDSLLVLESSFKPPLFSQLLRFDFSSKSVQNLKKTPKNTLFKNLRFAPKNSAASGLMGWMQSVPMTPLPFWRPLEESVPVELEENGAVARKGVVIPSSPWELNPLFLISKSYLDLEEKVLNLWPLNLARGETGPLTWITASHHSRNQTLSYWIFRPERRGYSVELIHQWEQIPFTQQRDLQTTFGVKPIFERLPKVNPEATQSTWVLAHNLSPIVQVVTFTSQAELVQNLRLDLSTQKDPLQDGISSLKVTRRHSAFRKKNLLYISKHKANKFMILAL